MASNATIGSGFGIKKTQKFNTIAQETTAFQGSLYIAGAVYPIWLFTITVPQLTGRMDDPTSPLAQLNGLFNVCRGRAGSFLLQDPDDYQVIAYQFGTGDGTSQTFQLTRPIGSAGVDIVQNVNTISNISINGTPTTAYAIDSRGVVTFNVAPAAAAVLSWEGTFYFRVRFAEDTLADLTEYFSDRWSINTLSLTSVIL
jgi:uncharacterized protein (TIGR02217 family)